MLDLLKIEGTNHFSVLCYGIFSKENKNYSCNTQLKINSVCTGFKNFIFEDSEWKFNIFLNESYFLHTSHVTLSSLIKNSVTNMEKLNPIAIVCMFDGVFFDFNYLKNMEIIQQTYAFWSKKTGIHIAENVDTLYSNNWIVNVSQFYDLIEQV